ncbi:MAG: UDP-N-acetylmuramate dehydrogenase [Mycobacteriales bacterium]
MLDRADVPLAPLTTLRLGGPARRLVTAYDEESLVGVVHAADDAGEPLLVLGGGSNLVLPDAGFAGTVVRVAVHGLSATQQDARVLLTAGAGEEWESLVGLCVADRLAGIEALSGIPGLVGAGPVQNIGAYGQDVSQTITAVRAYDRSARTVVTLTAPECEFSYRSSVFKRAPGRWVVLSVTFGLTSSELSGPVGYAELARRLGVPLGATAPLGEVREAVLALRRGKGMVLDAADPDTRSAGSFFTNPLLTPTQLEHLLARVPETPPSWSEPDGRTKVSAAWLIERSGFGRGAFDGAAGISGKHPLALVNRGGATTADLLRVARAVRDGVRERFGVELVPEPVLVGEPL